MKKFSHPLAPHQATALLGMGAPAMRAAVVQQAGLLAAIVLDAFFERNLGRLLRHETARYSFAPAEAVALWQCLSQNPWAAHRFDLGLEPLFLALDKYVVNNRNLLTQGTNPPAHETLSLHQ